MPEEGYKNKSLRKALLLLEALLDAPSMGVTELSEKFGLNKSNVHDILSTFRAMGYVQQNGETSKYSLGFKLLDFSRAISLNLWSRQPMQQHLQDLAVETGESVFYGICDGQDVVYLEAAFPARQQVFPPVIGLRAPLYCTAIGKAMLSAMPEETWDSHIPEKLEKITDNTITDKGALYQSLRETREKGFGVDNMEYEHGIASVAVAIVDYGSKIHGGICISGPSPRFTQSQIEKHARRLREKTKLLSSAY